MHSSQVTSEALFVELVYKVFISLHKQCVHIVSVKTI